MINRCFGRVLIVKLRQQIEGSTKILTFGDNYPEPDVSITVKIRKYMSMMKDNALITIDNLPYYQVIQIVNGKFYDVEIIAGYRNGNQMTLFKGSVLRITNSLNSDRTNTINIMCGSSLIAKYSQRLINYNLNSGLNVYSAIRAISKLSGINSTQMNISTQFKKQFIQDNKTVNSNVGSYIESLLQNNSEYIGNSDGTDGTTFSIYSAMKSSGRVVKVRDQQFLGGYPQLTNSGLTFSVLPTFNFKCGDTIIIDNASISLDTITSLSDLSNNSGYYLDKEGAYVIMSIDISLQNRGSNFSTNINAKARGLISNFLGVN